ncbi:MAG: hypothetical protein ACMUEM_00455 [Flavobacteriales bacterium AspAUS03]
MDVMEDVELDLITDSKYVNVFTCMNHIVVEIQKIRSLHFGIPAAKFVPYGKNIHSLA